MDACSLRQDQQRGRARWWRSRLRSETDGSEQGRYILRHSAVGGLTQSTYEEQLRAGGRMNGASSFRGSVAGMAARGARAAAARLNGFIEGTHRRPLGVMWNDPPESAPLTVISCVPGVVPLSHPQTLLGSSI